MKPKKLLFLSLAAFLTGQTQVFAQSTWIGTGTTGTPALWSDSANWTGTVPTNGATVSLTFLNSAANSVATNDLTGLTVSSINVPANDGAAVPVNIKDNTVGGNAVILAGNVTVSTGNWQRFNFDMDLGNAQRAFGINSGETFLGGNLSGATASIRKNNAATLNLSGNNSFGGSPRVSIGNGRVNLLSTSALGAAGGTIFFDSGNNKTVGISSDTPINSYNISAGSAAVSDTVILGRTTGGAAYVQPFGVMEYGARSLTFNQGGNVTSGRMTASVGELKMTGGNDNQPVMLAGNAAITLGSASITANGIAKRLQLDGTDANNAITGSILDTTNSTTGAVINLIKSNSSTWTLSGANNYTGTTSITGGTLRLTKRASLYNGDDTKWTGAKISVSSGATLALLCGGTDEFTTADTTTLLSNLLTSDPGGLLAGSIILFDTSNAAGGSFTVEESLVNSASGAISLTKAGANTLVLSGTNDYTGQTLITGGRLVTDYVSNSVRFTAGAPSATNGVIELTSNTSIGPVDFASGTGNGGTIILNRTGTGAGLVYDFGVLELSSVTMTVNKGDQVTSGNSSVDFDEVRMTGGNDNNPVTIAGDADITIGSASITNNGLSKRLQLDGSSPNNKVTGVISDSSVAILNAKVNLIKAGLSTWHLQGNNTYTGDTTILDGTLKLDFPCLNNDSTVRIDGTLELNHSQEDTVTSLFINGVEMPPGIYRSNANPGTGTEVAEITGTGTLNVLTGPSTDPFVTWAQQNITAIDPLADATPGGDPDGDGENNLAEYAFRGNPLSGTDQGLVRSFTEDSGDVDSNKELILTIAIRKANAAAFSGSPLQLVSDGVTYTVQGSTDLATFNAPVTVVSPPISTGLPDLSADPSYEYRSFSLDASNGLTGKGFLRAVVED